MTEHAPLVASAFQTKEDLELVEYSVGDLYLQPRNQKAFVNEVPLLIQPKSFLILHSLALKIHQQRNPLLLKQELLFNLYGAKEFWPKSNSCEVFLNRLRSALIAADSEWEIVPVRTKGYELRKKEQP